MKKLINNANLFFEKNKKQIEIIQRLKQEQTFVLDLSSKETSQIDDLFSQQTFRKDLTDGIDSIKILTSQIKSIQKQHILLVGEKIFKVRSIIQKMQVSYTTFSSWINLVFPTKSSAYNALAYYEFFIHLPNDQTKQIFQSIPHKVAYVLAARKGAYEKKVTILNQLLGKKNQDAIRIVNAHLPSSRPALLNLNPSQSLKNKIISEKLLDIVNEIDNGLCLSDYNINLIKQIMDLVQL